MATYAKELAQLPLAEAARLVRAKEVSPVELVEACFSFLPVRVALDLAGWAEVDIFVH